MVDKTNFINFIKFKSLILTKYKMTETFSLKYEMSFSLLTQNHHIIFIDISVNVTFTCTC